MCGDNQIEMPEWLQEKINKMWEDGMFQAIRCYPSLGIHEHCKHVGPEPTFKDIGNVR